MTILLNAPRSGSRAARHTRLDSLDGLRAIAVVLVLLYHVGVPGMYGGFLGVDVFFVLSGFLITTLLIRELTGRGTIDLGRFWLRRILRLLPASLLVIAVVLIWSVAAAPDYRRPNLGADAFWSLVYVGNWRFIASSGYFENDGSVSPLQHVWSLAVEEQFYLVWPLLLTLVVVPVLARVTARAVATASDASDSASRLEVVGLRRAVARRWILIISVVLAVASAAWFAVVYDPAYPDRAYMGTDTRAFEPLVGAAAAALVQYRPVQLFVARKAQALMIAGLIGLAIGVALFGGRTAPTPLYFRGGGFVFAIVVSLLVAGTSVADRRQGLSLLLGSTPIAYLGRISYGLYLWHWPIALWLVGDRPFSLWRSLLAAGLTIVVAGLSYQYFEWPLRTGRLSAMRPGRLVPASAGIVAVVTVFTSVLGGTPWNRVLPAVAGYNGATGDGRAVVVVGDSVIQRLLPALDAEGSARGLSVTSGARGGCPALGVLAVDDKGDPLARGNCMTQVIERQQAAVAATRPATVVWWSRYEVSDRKDAAGNVLRAGTPEFWQAQMADLRASVDRLTAEGARLVFVEMDRPGIGIDTRCTPQDCPAFLDRIRGNDELRQEWNRRVRRYASSDPRVSVIAVEDLYCRDAATPCDDHLPMRSGQDAAFPEAGDSLARPDGSHFGEDAGPGVARALLDRAVGSAGAGNGN